MPPREVTLEEVLIAREERVARQRALLADAAAELGRTGTAYSLVSVTLVSPGPIKNGHVADRLFDVAMEALSEVVASAHWPIRHREERVAATGPEAFVVLAAAPATVKSTLAELEDTHQLGRLWDLDVLGVDGSPLARTGLGLPERTCLLCDRPSRECARSRAHSVDELRAHVVETLARWEAGR